MQLLDMHSNVTPASSLDFIMRLHCAPDAGVRGTLPELQAGRLAATTDEHGLVDVGTVAIKPGTGRAPMGRLS